MFSYIHIPKGLPGFPGEEGFPGKPGLPGDSLPGRDGLVGLVGPNGENGKFSFSKSIILLINTNTWDINGILVYMAYCNNNSKDFFIYRL